MTADPIPIPGDGDVPDLDAWLDDVLAPDDAPTGPADVEGGRPVWRVESREAADWAMRKLARAQSAIDANGRLADDRMHAIHQWVTHANAAPVRAVEFFAAALTGYHQRVIADEEAAGTPDRKLTKSISLPAGTLVSRKRLANVRVEDAEAFIEWVRRDEQLEAALVRVKREPDKHAIKLAAFQRLEESGCGWDIVVDWTPTDDGTLVDPATGEVVPGLRHEPEGRTFDVKPGVSGG